MTTKIATPSRKSWQSLTTTESTLIFFYQLSAEVTFSATNPDKHITKIK